MRSERSLLPPSNAYRNAVDLNVFMIITSPLARNNLNQLKDAYTKLFEDYNELQEEKKKKEVQNDGITILD